MVRVRLTARSDRARSPTRDRRDRRARRLDASRSRRRHGEGPRATAKRDVQPVAHAHGRHARPVQGLGVGHGDARQGERGRRGRVLRAAARRDGVVRRSETTTTRNGDATMTRDDDATHGTGRMRDRGSRRRVAGARRRGGRARRHDRERSVRARRGGGARERVTDERAFDRDRTQVRVELQGK